MTFDITPLSQQKDLYVVQEWVTAGDDTPDKASEAKLARGQNILTIKVALGKGIVKESWLDKKVLLHPCPQS